MIAGASTRTVSRARFTAAYLVMCRPLPLWICQIQVSRRLKSENLICLNLDLVEDSAPPRVYCCITGRQAVASYQRALSGMNVAGYVCEQTSGCETLRNRNRDEGPLACGSAACPMRHLMASVNFSRAVTNSGRSSPTAKSVNLRKYLFAAARSPAVSAAIAAP